MYKGRIKTLIFIVVFLLVLATAITLLLDMEKQRQTVQDLGYDPFAATPVPTPVPTVTPMPVSTIMPTQAPATPVPTPVPTPIPATPAPTPIPTPTPVPVGQTIASGSFSSDTGVPLNLRAVWTAQLLDANRVRVKVEVYLESYSLQIIASRNALNVSVGDSYLSTDTPAVDLDDNTSLHSSLIGTTEHTLQLAGGESGSFPVQVQYLFRGVYFNREIDTIECGGIITLSR